MLVRKATLNDLDALVDFGERIVKEAPNFNQFDSTSTRSFLGELIIGNRSVFIAEDDYLKPIGTMISTLGVEWFSGKKVAYELCLYVLPKYRNSSAGSELIKEFVIWANDQSVDAIHAGTTTGISSNKVSKLYESQGFNRTGFCFAMEF
ncbi:GNAT family N-acetyltransferase [Acinetobacter proteolyticus]|uniref:GNAT family N-acetyltransferase n=1 Tax=Acinetobacter proteolyticus TaxID=1776741 RepID=UPI0008633EDF|nr:GNAT family N-acetyltransferase [Acinetobacter proteolyticus]OEY96052.1 GNAT family N-acetyltransferase [Acinetobacter proteolyticus]